MYSSLSGGRTYSMSVNAQRRLDEYSSLNKTNFTKSNFEKMLTEYGLDVDLNLKIFKKFTKKKRMLALTSFSKAEEWHHVGIFATETDFFTPRTFWLSILKMLKFEQELNGFIDLTKVNKKNSYEFKANLREIFLELEDGNEYDEVMNTINTFSFEIPASLHAKREADKKKKSDTKYIYTQFLKRCFDSFVITPTDPKTPLKFEQEVRIFSPRAERKFTCTHKTFLTNLCVLRKYGDHNSYFFIMNKEFFRRKASSQISLLTSENSLKKENIVDYILRCGIRHARNNLGELLESKDSKILETIRLDSFKEFKKAQKNH